MLGCFPYMTQSLSYLMERAARRVDEQIDRIRRHIRFIRLRTSQQLPTHNEEWALVEMLRTLEELRQDLATLLHRRGYTED